jgi:hypothetical protein
VGDMKNAIASYGINVEIEKVTFVVVKKRDSEKSALLYAMGELEKIDVEDDQSVGDQYV